jgi:Na+-translocating ferredoxin:NAD+ oxidoreductase RnfC subunit
VPAQAIGEIVAPVKAPEVKAKAEAKTKAKAQPKPPAKKAKPAPKAMAQAKAVPALNTEKVDHATTAKVLLGPRATGSKVNDDPRQGSVAAPAPRGLSDARTRSDRRPTNP